MPAFVAALIKPKNSGLFPTVEDVDCFGGFQVRATTTDRNSIPTANRKQGMMVYVVADGYFYQLGSGLANSDWALPSFGAEVSLGGDVSGPTSTNVVTSLTGSAGTISIATTGAALVWNLGAATPSLSQADITTGSATGQILTIHAQNATGSTSIGGILNLSSGTGTSTAGVLNLQTGRTTIASVTGNKFALSKGFRRNVFSALFSSFPLTVVDGYDIIAVGALPADGYTVTLPDSPTLGDSYIVKDAGGTAATHAITIWGNSGHTTNIDGVTNIVINANRESVEFIWMGSEWGIF